MVQDRRKRDGGQSNTRRAENAPTKASDTLRQSKRTPHSKDRDPLLQLQRTNGNRAVQRLVTERLRPKARPRLEIGPPDNTYEREADRAAERVVRTPESAVTERSDGESGIRVQRMCSRCRDRSQRGRPLDCTDCERKLQPEARVRSSRTYRPRLQRVRARGTRAAGGEFERRREGRIRRAATDPTSDGAPAIVSEVLRLSGQSLDPTTRGVMEERFGHDFGQVRVHTGPKAAKSAQAVNAAAYTVGQDIVFGSRQYRPDSSAGLALIAHELTHTVQQASGTWPADTTPVGPQSDQREDEAESLATGRLASSLGPGIPESLRASNGQNSISTTGGQLLQRQSVTESLGDFLSDPTVQSFGGLGTELVSSWLSDPRNRQFAKDIEASVREAPQHVGEFFEDEVWEAIREHWPQIVAVTLGIVAAEVAIAALTGVPEPTLLTKVIAAILQVAVIAILGYFAAVEVTGAYDAGTRWLSAARRADGDPAAITEASRSFVRMLWHIVMAVLVVAGVRVRPRGATVPRGGAPTGGGTSGSATASGGGATVTPISAHPRFRPAGAASPPQTPRTPSAFASEGSAARNLAPVEQPLPQHAPVPPAPTPAPIARQAPVVTAGPRPRLRPESAWAVGLSSAEREREREHESCSLTELFPLGGNREHDALAAFVTGQPVEYQLTTTDGIFSARYDGMDAAGTLYEIKTRHDFLHLLDQPDARLGPRGVRAIAEGVPNIIDQLENQAMVAAACGYEFRVATNNLGVVEVLRELGPGVPVEYVEFPWPDY